MKCLFIYQMQIELRTCRISGIDLCLEYPLSLDHLFPSCTKAADILVETWHYLSLQLDICSSNSYGIYLDTATTV